MTSSKQELEFCSFLKSQFPHLTFVDAWSKFGQKKFKESFPDSYCLETKTAFYFNGCLIHGHPIKECKFKRKKEEGRNYFNVPYEEAYKSHQNKLLLLQKNHPNEVESTETIWECMWQKRKAEDKTLKDFLKRYMEPPLRRLDVKACVRGGLNELYNCFWHRDNNLAEVFFYADMNSSYPHHAAQELPVGDSEVTVK